jgi:antitoxin component of RelBE/YafQ-DinJ toxin-antitoxin module
MPHLSVRISDQLLEQLIERGVKIGVDNVSDTVRILLQQALENPHLGLDRTLLQQMAHYAFKTHSIVEIALLSLVVEGEKLRDKAHSKAENLMSDLLEESF